MEVTTYVRGKPGAMIWLLVGYLFLFIHRPFEIWPALGAVRIELLYMLCAGALWLLYPNKRLTLDPVVCAVAGLAAVLGCCAMLSRWPDVCLASIEDWFKFLVFFLMLITVVQSEADLRLMVLAFLVIMAGFVAHSLYEFVCGRHVMRMGIQRLIGIDGGDPNGFAMTVVLSLVFVPAVWKTSTAPLVRPFLAGYLALAVLCVCLTGSRGGFIAMLVWSLIAMWGSPWRGRLLAVVLPVAPLLFLALPPSLQTRFETIVNPDAGPKNARESGQGRIDGFWAGMQLWQDNPLLGVGPGAYCIATGRKLRPHNLYGQVAGETGTVGVVALTGLVLAYVATVRRIRRTCREAPDCQRDGFLYAMAGAIGVALFLLLLGGMMGHNLLRPHWVLYGAFLSIAARCAADRAAEAYDWTWSESNTDSEPGELASGDTADEDEWAPVGTSGA